MNLGFEEWWLSMLITWEGCRNRKRQISSNDPIPRQSQVM